MAVLFLPKGRKNEKNVPQCETFLYGAEDEIRTRDVHLGKVTLYH